MADGKADPGLAGNLLVDELGQAQAISSRFEGGDGAMFEGLDAQRPGAPALEQLFQKGIGGTEVEQRNRARLPVHAPTFDDAPVGATFGPDRLEACHAIMYTSIRL